MTFKGIDPGMCVAALFLLIVNCLTVNTDVGDQVFGFLAFRRREFICVLGRFSFLKRWPVGWKGSQLAQLRDTSYDINSVNDNLHLNGAS